MRTEDKNSIKQWDSFVKGFQKSPHIDFFETPEQKRKRIAFLLSDFEAFCKYYFPGVCKSAFANWHRKFHKYVYNNPQAFFVGQICRDMAKSSIAAMEEIFLYFNGEIKSMILVSRIQEQAEMLISPIKVAFERNEALIRDFGSQVGSVWKSNRFITVKGVSFRAIGAGQNPRGEKNEESDRPDYFRFDDFDDPEVCRNPERLDFNWEFVLGDCFGALHVSGRRRIVFMNNIIDEDCIIVRAGLHAKNIKDSLVLRINLVDTAGNSNWPEAYSNEQCFAMIDLLGDAADVEYMQNPVKKGKHFQKDWFVFKKMPPLNKYKFLVAYLDGGFKKTRTSDTKALLLVGYHNNEYHIRKAYVDNVSIGTMIAWHYDLHEILQRANGTAMWWMEEVFLLSLLHDHFDAAIPKYGFRIPILGDKRKKPDKDLRIANTAGDFERGRVFFDEAIKDDRGVQRLIKQYLRFRVGLNNIEKDGPDAFEGARHILNSMSASSVASFDIGQRTPHNKRI